jgi:TonB family protein
LREGFAAFCRQNSGILHSRRFVACGAAADLPDPPRLPDGTPPPLRGEVGNASSSGGRQTGGGFGGGAIFIGGGVSAPVPIYQVEPEYSEEARKAKWQGTVLLSPLVDETGKPVPACIKVAKSLALGLDQKAIECVKKWRFKRARKTASRCR